MKTLLPETVKRMGRPIKRMGRMILDSGRDYRANKALNKALIRGLGQYNTAQPVGRCLISYITEFISHLCQHPEVGLKGWDAATLPAKMEQLSRGFSGHTMYWESAEMVRQFIERGFVVDCIYDREGCLVKDVSCYDVIVDEWNNLPLWTLLNPHAKKLYYATGCHWIFHNQAELIRHEWLFSRRGVVVPTRRQVPPLLGPETADLISSFGNGANTATFGIHAPKVRKLWISATGNPSELKPKNWQVARNRFLWFGGGGWVHKGLDLVIEAFLKEPQFQLIICGGGIKRDEAFWKIYGPDIGKAGNIVNRGYLDPLGSEFREIAASTCAVIYPSAAEGCSGGIVQCLHHGLIPLVTEIVGLEIHDTWPPLMGSTDAQLIEQIRRRCHEVAEMPLKQLDEWRSYFWEYAHKNHTREAYSRSFSRLLDELLSG